METLNDRRGTLLMENLIFIILNLVFISIIILFLFVKMTGAAVLEEKYAKEIALLVDSAEPGMKIYVDMTDAIERAQKENWPASQIVTINGNIITVKLREKGGYSYSYFNDISVSVNPKGNEYYLIIG